MRNRRQFALLIVLGVTATSYGCEPESVVAARERLGRGAPNVLSLVLPLANDTFTVSELLPENKTLITQQNGVLAIEVTSSSVGILVQQGISFVDVPSPRVELDGDTAFGDLDSAVAQSTMNDATLEIAATNRTGVPVVLDNATLGAVRLDVPGQPAVVDGGGSPILIDLADPAGTTLSVPIGGTTLSVQAAALMDPVVHHLLDGEGIAFAISGTTTVGPAGAGNVDFDFDLVVGLDFTIPVTGVSFTSSQSVDGLNLDGDDADDLAGRLVSASAVAVVDNLSPFGVRIDIGLAEGTYDGDIDIFSLPDVVTLDPISFGGPPVDASGFPTASVTDSIALTITGDDARVLLGENYTAALRVSLEPGSGGGGRGAFRAVDRVSVDASVAVEIRRGTP